MTATTDSNFIHRELGKISAQIEAMQRSQDESREEIKTANKTLNVMDDRMANVEKLSHKNSKTLTEDVMPTVAEVKAWKQRGAGFLAFAGFAGTGLGATIIAYLEDIKSFLNAFFR